MARSPRRHGSINSIRPGVYEICVEHGTDPRTGRRRRRTATVHGTRREAERALAALSAEVRSGPAVATAAGTFGALLESWWNTMATHRWEDATAIRHRTDIRLHLAGLARRRLRDLTADDFDQLYARLARSGKSPRTIQHVHGTARAALNHAVRQRLIAHNPTAGAVVPTRRKARRKLPASDQLAAVLVLAADGDGMWAAFFRVAFHTGARPAELCALRWADVNLDRAEVHIAAAMGRSLDGGFRRKGTKTQSESDDGERVVAIDLATAAALRRWRAVLASRLLSAGHKLDGRFVVFPADAIGQREMRPDVPSKRWRSYARAAGIDDAVRLYDAARHHHISWCLTMGFPVAAVAERVGNSPEIIYRTYAHVLREGSRAIADAIDQQTQSW